MSFFARDQDLLLNKVYNKSIALIENNIKIFSNVVT